MNGKLTAVFSTLFLCFLLFPCESASARSTLVIPHDSSVFVKQNDITITCPAQIDYHAQAIAEWNVGFYVIKRLMFEDASVAGRTLTCNYSANSGGTRDSSMLTRDAPRGYICTVRPNVNKNRQFDCKRAIAPIKVKPKTD
jgi:hypothetical protein